ncbi:MAG: phosphoglycerate kinase [Patescibacteria group bacterium]
MIKFLSDSVAKKYAGKTCLLRIDLNTDSRNPLNSYKLEAVIPTIKLLLKNKVKVIILSHCGRPKSSDRKLSLRLFAPIIAKKISHRVDFCRPADVVLLENMRFLPGEERNDDKLARQLASLGDFYVNDAFAVSHRNNASVCAVTKYLPSYAGLCLEKEMKNLGAIVDDSTHPFVVVLGGAKLKEKILKLKKLVRKADSVLLGSNAFNESGIPKQPKFIWPDDARKNGKFIWDIGPFTVNSYADLINEAGTIIWNGPPGLFEKKGFEKGTIGIWKAVLSNRKAKIIIGGGETIASLSLIHNSKFIIPRNLFISTGGGAMLGYLSGKKLPGIEALK